MNPGARKASAGEADHGSNMAGVSVIDTPAAATAAIDPLRSRILACLAEPGSATSVAASTGESRQKVNYHIRALETQGLVRQVGTRPRRGLTERLVQSSARSYVLSPAVLGENAADPNNLSEADRLSADYLAAVAARVVQDIAELSRLAAADGKKLPTMTIDTEVRFASAKQRAAFTDELAESVKALVAKYHDETTPGGRGHRLVVGAHPLPPGDPKKQPTIDRQDASGAEEK